MFAILLFGAKLVRVRMSTWVAALCVIGFCATRSDYLATDRSKRFWTVLLSISKSLCSIS
jgi:hypothetical protein